MQAMVLIAAFSPENGWFRRFLAFSLLTGLPLAILLFAVCRAAGKIIGLFGERLVFQAECAETVSADSGTVLYVRFADSSGLSHRAALRVSASDAGSLTAGSRVKIAVDREAFRMGSYPQTVPEAAQSREVLLLPEYRADRRKRFVITLVRELLICAAAAALFLIVRHLFFG